MNAKEVEKDLEKDKEQAAKSEECDGGLGGYGMFRRVADETECGSCLWPELGSLAGSCRVPLA